jgi:cell division protein FtsB
MFFNGLAVEYAKDQVQISRLNRENQKLKSEVSMHKSIAEYYEQLYIREKNKNKFTFKYC